MTGVLADTENELRKSNQSLAEERERRRGIEFERNDLRAQVVRLNQQLEWPGPHTFAPPHGPRS